jgi:hypothetical protein
VRAAHQDEFQPLLGGTLGAWEDLGSTVAGEGKDCISKRTMRCADAEVEVIVGLTFRVATAWSDTPATTCVNSQVYYMVRDANSKTTLFTFWQIHSEQSFSFECAAVQHIIETADDDHELVQVLREPPVELLDDLVLRRWGVDPRNTKAQEMLMHDGRLNHSLAADAPEVTLALAMHHNPVTDSQPMDTLRS